MSAETPPCCGILHFSRKPAIPCRAPHGWNSASWRDTVQNLTDTRSSNYFSNEIPPCIFYFLLSFYCIFFPVVTCKFFYKTDIFYLFWCRRILFFMNDCIYPFTYDNIRFDRTGILFPVLCFDCPCTWIKQGNALPSCLIHVQPSLPAFRTALNQKDTTALICGFQTVRIA